MFNKTLVIVNKEPAEIHERDLIFPLQKFQCACKGVPCATAQLPLIFDLGTEIAQVHRSRESPRHAKNGAEHEVAMIRQIRHPAIAAIFTHFLSYCRYPF